MITMLEAAQAIAKSGIPIFPCDPASKRPAIAGGRGFLDATTDVQQVAEWWFAVCPESSIGMPTGDIFVIDVDDTSVELPFDLPETLEVETQHGGRHIYLRAPDGVRITNKQGVIPGVDVRGHGGYVLIPPSPGYRVVSYVDWPDIPVAPLEAVRFVTGLGAAPRGVVTAGSNGHSRHRHALELGLSHEANKLEIGEGLKILLNDPKVLSAISDDPRRAWEMVRTYREGRGYRQDKGQLVQPVPLDFRKVLTEPDDPIPWLVPGIVARGDSVILAGEPKSGKSLLALEWAMAVGSGDDFCRLIKTQKTPVVYIDAENPLFAVKKRIRQVAIPRGYDGDGFRYYSRETFNLSDQRWVSWLKDLPPSFVVLDSLARMHRGEENSNTAMSQLWADAIGPITSAGHTVLALHHLRKPSKDDAATEGFMSAHRSRGASGLMANVDQMFGLSRRNTGLSVLEHQLARHEDPHPTLDIRFDVVEFDGIDCWSLTALEARDGLEIEFLKIVAEKLFVARQEVMRLMNVDYGSNRYQQFKRMQKSVVSRKLVRVEKQGRETFFAAVE